MGILLAILAYALIYIFSIPLILYACISKHNFNAISAYFFIISESLDQLGNVIAGPFFNHFFITKDGSKYGNEDETISSCTGRNFQSKTLTIIGRIFRWVIDLCFGKNHCINAIGS